MTWNLGLNNKESEKESIALTFEKKKSDVSEIIPNNNNRRCFHGAVLIDTGDEKLRFHGKTQAVR